VIPSSPRLRQGVPAGRCPAERLLEELTNLLDAYYDKGSAGACKPDLTRAEVHEVPCSRSAPQEAGGNAEAAAKTRNRAASRMNKWSCDVCKGFK
jgi:hypothetical protein